MRLTELFFLLDPNTTLNHETRLKVTHLNVHDSVVMDSIIKGRTEVRSEIKKEEKTKKEKVGKKKYEKFDLFD